MDKPEENGFTGVKCIYCGWPHWQEDGPEVEAMVCGACRFKQELAEIDNKAKQRAMESLASGRQNCQL